MKNDRIIGITLLVVGAVLLATGYRSSGTAVDQLSDAFLGRYTDRTMWYIVGGIAAMIGGGLMVMRSSKSA